MSIDFSFFGSFQCVYLPFIHEHDVGCGVRSLFLFPNRSTVNNFKYLGCGSMIFMIVWRLWSGFIAGKRVMGDGFWWGESVNCEESDDLRKQCEMFKPFFEFERFELLWILFGGSLEQDNF